VPLAAKNTAGSPPMLNSAGTAYFATGSGADLRPETSFGYDFGVDRRLNGAGIIVSTDTWLTNLFGQYFTSTVQSGTFAGLPLYINAPRNLNRSRYYGVEATIQSIAKPIGPFFTVSGALMRAYTYDLPAHFYDTPVVDAKGNTTWTPFTSNLAIIPGLNFRGGYYVGGAGNGSEAIPYSNGSASAGYRFAHNTVFTLYATYYGPNNGYYKPAFVTLSTDLRVPLTERTSAQFTVDNLTNKYPGVYQYLFDQEGVGIPLADGTLGQAPTEGLGPRTLR